MSSANYCFLTCILISQEAGQVVWYSHLLKNFPEFLVIHIVEHFGIVNKAEGRTRLSDFTFTFHFHVLEKEMATHSSVLPWRIPGMGEPGDMPSLGSHRIGHDWSYLAAAAKLQRGKITEKGLSNWKTLNLSKNKTRPGHRTHENCP